MTPMFQLNISPELSAACPHYRVAAVYAEVQNTPYNEGLWQEIEAFTQKLRAEGTTDSIKQQPAIAATREAYRRLGKDPSRYRPSAEALRRRLLRGLELYRIDTLVPHPWRRPCRRAVRGHRARSAEHRGAARVARRTGRHRHPHQRP